MQFDSKEESALKAYLIVIFGPPASGKSTFARRLSQAYKDHCQKTQQQASELLISADCLEEYLRTHIIFDLEEVCQNKQYFQQIMQLRLKRSQFIEQSWKNSRRLIKQRLPAWLKVNKLVIVEDDMLLKSQRKDMRHISEQEKCLYLQIFVDSSLERCRDNLKNRQINEEQQYHLSLAKFEDAFSKFQLDSNPYLMKLKPDTYPQWIQIAQHAKIVKIEHPQLEEKHIAPQENQAKDDVQVKIRKFVSEIISNKALQKKYFPDADTKKVAYFVNSIKKKYAPKNKTFEGFLEFFQNETSMIH